MAESLSYVLEAPHRQFATACDGLDGLAKVAEQRFDLIITDHRMPRLGGLDFVRRLRQQNFAGKVVVLSAHLSPEDVMEYQTLAVDRILAKPFDASNLRKVIGEIERDARQTKST